jgi:hypothetical protein
MRIISKVLIIRLQTTLKLAIKREHITQCCYCSLFKVMEDYEQRYEIHQRRCEKTGTELCKEIFAD